MTFRLIFVNIDWTNEIEICLLSMKINEKKIWSDIFLFFWTSETMIQSHIAENFLLSLTEEEKREWWRSPNIWLSINVGLQARVTVWFYSLVISHVISLEKEKKKDIRVQTSNNFLQKFNGYSEISISDMRFSWWTSRERTIRLTCRTMTPTRGNSWYEKKLRRTMIVLASFRLHQHWRWSTSWSEYK